MASSRSKVEIKGIEAKFYDQIMDIITFGGYRALIKNAVQLMDLKEGYRVLDMGCGTGRNDCYIYERIGEKGKVVGIDISDTMLRKAKKKCRKFETAEFVKARIEGDLPFENEFDTVFISFVFHGFERYDQEKIARNAYRALKKGGKFYILDYNEFDVSKSPIFVRFFIRYIECPLAEEFINLDLKSFLREVGFKDFKEWKFAFGYIRLLEALK